LQHANATISSDAFVIGFELMVVLEAIDGLHINSKPRSNEAGSAIEAERRYSLCIF
jgi:hypothetical protein